MLQTLNILMIFITNNIDNIYKNRHNPANYTSLKKLHLVKIRMMGWLQVIAFFFYNLLLKLAYWSVQQSSVV